MRAGTLPGTLRSDLDAWHTNFRGIRAKGDGFSNRCLSQIPAENPEERHRFNAFEPDIGTFEAGTRLTDCANASLTNAVAVATVLQRPPCAFRKRPSVALAKRG